MDEVLRRAIDSGAIEVEGAIARERGWTPRLSASQSDLREKLIATLRTSGSEPPSVSDLTAAHGATISPLLRILEREGIVVPVEADRFYAAEAVTDLVDRLRKYMEPGREYSPAELRDVLGLSRKFLIPFLEYCDRKGVTERRTTGRVVPASRLNGT
jgi:selenocysteine-specific elongation factor